MPPRTYGKEMNTTRPPCELRPGCRAARQWATRRYQRQHGLVEQALAQALAHNASKPGANGTTFHSPCLRRAAKGSQPGGGVMPVVLWSCPGSGNTLLRELLELATGRLTGSVYHDRTLSRRFPAELAPVDSAPGCRGLSAIKVHGSATERPWSASLCGGTLSKLIVLVRHPFRAALAEYQRVVGEERVANLAMRLAREPRDSPTDRTRSAHGSDGSLDDAALLRSELLRQGPHTEGLASIDSATTRGGDWPSRSVIYARRWSDLLVPCTGAEPDGPPARPPAANNIGCSADKTFAGWLSASAGRSAAWVRYEDLTDPTSRAWEVQRLVLYAGSGLAPLPFSVNCLFSNAASLRRGSSLNVSAAIEPVAALMWREVQHAAPRFGYSRRNYVSR